jgi:hypothetical protein
VKRYESIGVGEVTPITISQPPSDEWHIPQKGGRKDPTRALRMSQLHVGERTPHRDMAVIESNIQDISTRRGAQLRRCAVVRSISGWAGRLQRRGRSVTRRSLRAERSSAWLRDRAIGEPAAQVADRADDPRDRDSHRRRVRPGEAPRRSGPRRQHRGRAAAPTVENRPSDLTYESSLTIWRSRTESNAAVDPTA